MNRMSYSRKGNYQSVQNLWRQVAEPVNSGEIFESQPEQEWSE